MYENTGIDFYFYNGILYYETTQEKGKIYKVESSELLKPEFIKKYDFEKYSKSINTALDSIYENFASLADSMKYENKNLFLYFHTHLYCLKHILFHLSFFL